MTATAQVPLLVDREIPTPAGRNARLRCNGLRIDTSVRPAGDIAPAPLTTKICWSLRDGPHQQQEERPRCSSSYVLSSERLENSPTADAVAAYPNAPAKYQTWSPFQPFFGLVSLSHIRPSAQAKAAARPCDRSRLQSPIALTADESMAIGQAREIPDSMGYPDLCIRDAFNADDIAWERYTTLGSLSSEDIPLCPPENIRSYFRTYCSDTSLAKDRYPAEKSSNLMGVLDIHLPRYDQ